MPSIQSRLALAVVLVVLFQASEIGQSAPTRRIMPINPDPTTWTPMQKEILGNAPVSDSFRVCIKSETVCRGWRAYMTAVGLTPRESVGKTSLAPREWEMLVLRVLALNRDESGWRTRRGEGFAGRKFVTDDDARRVAQGPKAAGWNEHDAALVQAVDDLIRDAFIRDDTWKILKKTYSDQQMIDVIFTVGGMHVSSWYILRYRSGRSAPRGQHNDTLIATS